MQLKIGQLAGSCGTELGSAHGPLHWNVVSSTSLSCPRVGVGSLAGPVWMIESALITVNFPGRALPGWAGESSPLHRSEYTFRLVGLAIRGLFPVSTGRA